MKRGERIRESAYERFNAALGHANRLVQPTGYLAGTRSLTIADISMAAGLSAFENLNHVDLEPHPQLREWLARMKTEIKSFKKYEAGAIKYAAWANAGLSKQ